MEQWKTIDEFPNYEISDQGRIRFIGGVRKFGHTVRYAPPGERKPQPHTGGYLQIVMHSGGKPRNRYVHRLVAQAFLPERGDRRFVNHKNGDKTDNRVENLEWVTFSENLLHASRVLNKNKHCRKGRKITPEEAAQIKASTGPARLVAEAFNVRPARVYRLRNEA